MGSIKTDSIEFATQRSLKDLTNALRRAISTTKAQVDRLEADDDPLGNDDVQPQVAVLLSGRSLMIGTRMWGVQVYLYDFGDRRFGELVALGESFLSGALNSYYNGENFQLGDSKKRSAQILSILTENDPTALIGDQIDAALDQEEAAIAAQSAPASSVVPAVSPDGVDPLKSELYTSIYKLRCGLSREEYANAAHALFSNACVEFADNNPDFPACSELKLIHAMGTEEGSEDRYVYQPYLDLFPDQGAAVKTAFTALMDWVEAHPDDVKALCLIAGGSSSVDAFDAVNERLYDVLVQESRGVNVENVLLLWTELALAADFESWYIDQFGAREGAFPPTPAESAPQVSSATAGRPNTAPKAAPSASAGAGAGASTDYSDRFKPLTDNNGRKIVLISAGIALALSLFLALAGRIYFYAIFAPALLFILLMMRKDVDSILMALPMTLTAVSSLSVIFNIMQYTSVPAIFYAYFLIDAAIAVVYWLLALKKALPANKATGLLLLLLGIRILLDLANLFSAFNYGIFSIMSALYVIAFGVSYFAAIFFAGKHLLGSLKK